MRAEHDLHRAAWRAGSAPRSTCVFSCVCPERSGHRRSAASSVLARFFFRRSFFSLIVHSLLKYMLSKYLQHIPKKDQWYANPLHGCRNPPKNLLPAPLVKKVSIPSNPLRFKECCGLHHGLNIQSPSQTGPHNPPTVHPLWTVVIAVSPCLSYPSLLRLILFWWKEREIWVEKPINAWICLCFIPNFEMKHCPDSIYSYRWPWRKCPFHSHR